MKTGLFTRLRAIRIAVSFVVGGLFTLGYHFMDKCTGDQLYGIIFWSFMVLSMAGWLGYSYRERQKETGDLVWSFTKYKAF